jgi:hypothetical protein
MGRLCQCAVPFHDIVQREHRRAGRGKGEAPIGGAEKDVNPLAGEQARQRPLLANNFPCADVPHDPNGYLVRDVTIGESDNVNPGACCQCVGDLMGVTCKPSETRVG